VGAIIRVFLDEKMTSVTFYFRSGVALALRQIKIRGFQAVLKAVTAA
jgi:hypothetical protein